MKKPLIALSLTLAMLTTVTFAAPSTWVTAELDTVPTGDWAYQAPITYGQLLELCPEAVTALDTDALMTREQVAIALAGAMDLDFYYQAPDYTDASDISPDAIYAVGQLQTAGMMNGYGDGRFDPQGDCTVEQTMVVLSRLSTATSNVTLYGTIAIPTAIQDQLLINPHNSSDNTLIEVYETASYTQSQADFGGDYGMGFLIAIKRYTQAEYEAYLCYDMAGHSIFATDDTYYYAKQVATDVQFYRSDIETYTEETMEDWGALMAQTNDIVDDFILRNNLTPYDERVDRDADYTYDGDHVTIRYNPYGSGDQFYTLTLSQPVTQGEGGIWCVERWTDSYGNVYLVFPSVIDGVDVSATDYYSASQADCDAGIDTAWLAPLTVAQYFVDEWFQTVPTDAVFEVVDTTDRWGITLTATDVTPTGMTLLCTQTGGAQQGQLQTSTPYFLEIYQDGGWETVDYLPQEYNIGWTTIAWMIPENQITEWTVDWAWLYGDLPNGTYRIGKSVMDFIETGIYEEQMYYAVFKIA